MSIENIMQNVRQGFVEYGEAIDGCFSPDKEEQLMSITTVALKTLGALTIISSVISAIHAVPIILAGGGVLRVALSIIGCVMGMDLFQMGRNMQGLSNPKNRAMRQARRDFSDWWFGRKNTQARREREALSFAHELTRDTMLAGVAARIATRDAMARAH